MTGVIYSVLFCLYLVCSYTSCGGACCELGKH